MMQVFFPNWARLVPRFIVTVVFPVPPFPDAKVKTLTI
jgi:hypothetical protein